MREGGREGGEGGEGGREVREGGREGDWMAGMCVKKGQWLAVSYPGRSGGKRVEGGAAPGWVCASQAATPEC